MLATLTKGDVQIVIDPADHFSGLRNGKNLPTLRAAIVDEAHILIEWACEYALLSEKKPLHEYMADRYGYPANWSADNLNILSDGRYQYVGDSDLMPLVKFTVASQPDYALYLYQYGLVGFTSDAEPTGTSCRMD